MFTTSLMGQSGQLWKFIVAVVALLVGSFAPLFPELGIGWTAGTILAIGGYCFGLYSIHCGACGQRWLWEATKGDIAYSVLFKDSTCPGCKN
jgi:hypothetical protein